MAGTVLAGTAAALPTGATSVGVAYMAGRAGATDPRRSATGTVARPFGKARRSGRAQRCGGDRRVVKGRKAQAAMPVAIPPFAAAQLDRDRRAAEKSKAALR